MSAAAWSLGIGPAHADPNALWNIVSGQCVPNEMRADDPAPCALVDLDRGDAGGYAVLKDMEGARQFLVIPTQRITGIESPAVLEPGATNYFAAAWHAKSFVDERAGQVLPRTWVSLAINSELARSQNQLHIHVDCVRADVHAVLQSHASAIGPTWAPFPVPLAGDPYSALAVWGENLEVNPFVLLADGLAGARADMGARTLAVVGMVGADGRPGFVILAGQAGAVPGDVANGEDLQDHDACPAPGAPLGK